MPSAPSLLALNFALAGAREGFGPFLGVYLQQQGFDPAATGVAMGLAGAAGLLATTPIGALIDRTRAKRAALAVAVAGIAVGALLIVATNHLWLIALGQLVIGVADTSVAPLVAALTLGIVGQAAYGGQVSRNEAANHAGNAANAALSAALGYALGLGWVVIAIVVMAVASCGVLLRIAPLTIDHEAARGGGSDARPTLRVLVETRPLLLLAGAVLAFETANGAILPFLAQARTAAGSDPSLTTGAMTVIGQGTMVAAALVAARVARAGGYRRVMTLALAAVIVRGVLAAFVTSWWMLVPVQMLEGLAMGFAGVAMPALAAEIMEDTGNANAGLAAVMTAFGAGATLSPVLAGGIAQTLGFATAFFVLAGIAALGLAVWQIGSRRLGLDAPVPPAPRTEDAQARSQEHSGP